jgi:membrane-associated protease RseP (regulator of RpoE activity)
LVSGFLFCFVPNIYDLGLFYAVYCLVNSLTEEKPEVVEQDSEPGRFEFAFPVLMVRTKIFGGLFDRLGASRFSRWLSWLALAIVPVVAGVGLFLLVSSLIGLLWSPGAAEAAREVGLGAYILLPGVNPYLPVLYGLFAIFCAIVIHEGAHGVAARSLGLKVNSSGLLFLLFIPIGAFVDVDEKELRKASGKVSSRVLASGVGGNVVVGALCLIGVLLIAGGLAPVVDGVHVGSVSEGLPAEAAGLLPGDVLVSVDGVAINSTDDLTDVLDSKTLGDLVEVTVVRGDKWQNQYSTFVSLTVSENRTIMGVGVGDLQIEQRLRNYLDVAPQSLVLYMLPPALIQGLVPFSDMLTPFYESWLGDQWAVFANVLFWIWFININVAVFNALPIYPFDGGRMFNIALKKTIHRKNSKKIVTAITAIVTATLVLVLVLIIALPFIL